MTRLLISGIEGRMGQEVLRLAPEYGFDAAAFAPGAAGDMILDFSHPDALDALLSAALPLVIGTTGYTETQQRRIEAAARERPIFQSANFSPGMQALSWIAETACRALPDWQAALIECHHAQKKDAPSGSALRLAEHLGLSREAVCSLRGGTVCGEHALTLFGPEEHLTLIHTAESRAVFAHGALRAAQWLLGKPAGLYGMADLMGSYPVSE